VRERCGCCPQTTGPARFLLWSAVFFGESNCPVNDRSEAGGMKRRERSERPEWNEKRNVAESQGYCLNKRCVAVCMERSGMHSATPLKKNEKNCTKLARIVTARYSLCKVIGLVVAEDCTILLRPCRAKSCAPCGCIPCPKGGYLT